MKAILVCSLALASIQVAAQTATKTDCSETGNTLHCTSTQEDTRTQGEINADAFKAGWKQSQQMRSDMARQRAERDFLNSVNGYCRTHAGQDWQIGERRGYCQTEDERLAASYLELESKHHEFDAKDIANIKTVSDYMEANHYDANSFRGWDKAFKELKKQGKLNLYAKGSY